MVACVGIVDALLDAGGRIAVQLGASQLPLMVVVVDGIVPWQLDLFQEVFLIIKCPIGIVGAVALGILKPVESLVGVVVETDSSVKRVGDGR